MYPESLQDIKILNLNNTGRWNCDGKIWVYVGRPWKGYSNPPGTPSFGNPFSVKQFGRWQAIEKYKAWFYHPERDYLRKYLDGLDRIAGFCCWCHPYQCHADVPRMYWFTRKYNANRRLQAKIATPDPRSVPCPPHRRQPAPEVQQERLI